MAPRLPMCTFWVTRDWDPLADALDPDCDIWVMEPFLNQDGLWCLDHDDISVGHFGRQPASVLKRYALVPDDGTTLCVNGGQPERAS
jgi:hypothetical protein